MQEPQTIREALKQAQIKIITTLMSRKFFTLLLSVLLLINGYVTQEVFLAIAVAFMGVIGYTEHIEKLTKIKKDEPIRHTPPPGPAASRRDAPDEPIP